jgi:hypothetical protein
MSDLTEKLAKAFNEAPSQLFDDASEGHPDAEQALARIALAVVREELLSDRTVETLRDLEWASSISPGRTVSDDQSSGWARVRLEVVLDEVFGVVSAPRGGTQP